MSAPAGVVAAFVQEEVTAQHLDEEQVDLLDAWVPEPAGLQACEPGKDGFLRISRGEIAARSGFTVFVTAPSGLRSRAKNPGEKADRCCGASAA